METSKRPWVVFTTVFMFEKIKNSLGSLASNKDRTVKVIHIPNIDSFLEADIIILEQRSDNNPSIAQRAPHS